MAGPAAHRRHRAGPDGDRSGPGRHPGREEGHLQPVLRVGSGAVNPLTNTPTGNRPEDDPDDERLPSFSEQVADQLGGIRGLIESSIPVTMFVIVNVISTVKTAVIVA